MTTLTALKTIAVAKAIATKDIKDARPNVKPGRRKIDMTVRIVGTIEVGDDFEQRLPAAIPWQVLATLALDKLNPDTVKKIVAAVRDAEDLDALVEDIKERTDVLVETLKDETMRPMKGKVNASLVVEEVR